MKHFVLIGVFAVLLLLGVCALVRQWRTAKKSGCPADVPCTGAGDLPDITAKEEVYTPPPPPAELPIEPSNWNKLNKFRMEPDPEERAIRSALGDALRGGPPSVGECHTAVEVAEAARNGGVVLFYATGCGPCNAFKPVYAAAAARAPLPFYAVDGMAVPEVVQRYNLAGFPTVYKFSGGKIVAQYSGDRTEGDLLMWASDR